MEEPKKKRGRKPKTEVVEETTVVSDTPAVEDVDKETTEKKKRGRKPKSVYNVADMATNPVTNTGYVSEDENVIVRLQVPTVSATVERFEPYEEQPVAYNRDNYFNMPNLSDFASSNEFFGETEKKSSCNEDIGLKVVDVLKDFEQKNKNNEWPANTSIACYWCCHRFDNSPFGIPVSYNNEAFEVFGCFCTLECAAAFNFKNNDAIDEVWERHNLIHLLARRLGINGTIKPAPDRLSLKMFGGFLDIEAFRNYSQSYKLINVNFPPMTSLTQQIEEVNEYELNPDIKYIPIDHERIIRCKEKMIFRRNKPLINEKTTLESTMNLKVGA